MRSLLLLILYTSISGFSLAQVKCKLYLGQGQDSLFTKSDMVRDVGGDYSFFDFAGYHTYRHELINTSSDENVNRAGLILPAKKTDTYSMQAEAVFGKDDDTCLLVYKAGIEKVNHGRSAAVSLLNLFSTLSGSGSIAKQPEPYDEIKHVDVSGIIYPDSLRFFYSFDHGSFGTYKLSGGLIYNGDTLTGEVADHFVMRKGKVRRFKQNSPPGIILKDKNTVYAAIDKYNNPTIFYLSNQLTEPKRLVLSAYMFIVACFQK